MKTFTTIQKVIKRLLRGLRTLVVSGYNIKARKKKRTFIRCRLFLQANVYNYDVETN